MRRWLPALLLALLICTPALRSGEKETPWKPITVSWHGQSFFIVTTSKGTKIAFDPHLIPDYGRPMGLKADIVLMSHNHSDHIGIDALDNAKDKKIRLIQGIKGAGFRGDWNRVDETIGDVHIRSVGLYHDESEGLERGKNTAFIVEVDGWKIAHLGDLGHQLSADQLKRIGDVDVLMIPVGGIYTLNGSDAKKVVADIKPKQYIFPMHYGTKIFDEVLPVTEFLEDQDRKKVAISDDNKVTLNRDPERPRPLIVVLNYAPKGR